MLGWLLLFIGAGWLVYKYRRTDIDQNEEESSSGLSPFAVFSIIVVILVVFVIIMAAVLYALVTPLPYYGKSSPIGSMIVFEDDGDNSWSVQIIKMNPQPSINSVHWYLMDIQGLTKDEGVVTDIYGYKQGEGKSIIFIDSDYNAKVSPGDIFTFYPGEGENNSSYSLADVPSLNDYSFRLKFDPTADTIGYDAEFTS